MGLAEDEGGKGADVGLSSSAAPLMSDQYNEDALSRRSSSASCSSPNVLRNGRGRETLTNSEHIERPTRFVRVLPLAASLSGLLFGYDTGIISSTLISIYPGDLGPTELSTLDRSFIVSATALFALFASPFAGAIADAAGRRGAMLLASCLFAAGAIMQALATSVGWLIAGRAVVGAAVGGASFVAPLYIGELSPSAVRGQLVTMMGLFVTGGQVAAYTVGWVWIDAPAGWRWMVGLGAVPAIVQGLLLKWVMPETPRWLVKNGRNDEAERVLLDVYGKGRGQEKKAKTILRQIEQEVLTEEMATTSTTGKRAEAMDTIRELVRVAAYRRALIIASMLQAFQQLCGFNTLMYFSAIIFTLAGSTIPMIPSLCIAITNFLATVLAFAIIDDVGRRRMLLFSIPLMTMALIVVAACFWYLDLTIASSNDPVRKRYATSPETGIQEIASNVLLPALMAYVAAYALGLGCVPWQQAELFPLAVRSMGSGIATSANWGSNFVVGLTFLPMLELLSPTGTFMLYSVVCAISWVCVWRYYPETAGLSLEAVGGLLASGWGVDGRTGVGS